METDITHQLIALVEKKLGLKPQMMAQSNWKDIFKERMASLQCATYHDYWRYLQNTSEEWQELIELIVVPETWFFRDHTVFTFLSRLIKQAKIQPPLKILSLACSSGEEPYSIVMTLFDLGLPQHSFTMDAVDISRIALRKAQRGIYTEKAFRNSDSTFRERYFSQASSGYVIDDRVKAQVNFYHGNVLNKISSLSPHSYSLIFCRNFLIYLNQESQMALLNMVKLLLSPQGICFVGSSETHLLHQADFYPIKVPKTYAFTLKSIAI